MPKTELGDFLQAAAEKQFGSAAKLSRECGLSQNTRQHNADGELTLEEHRLLDAYRGSSKDGQVMLLTMSQEVKEKLAAKRVRTK